MSPEARKTSNNLSKEIKISHVGWWRTQSKQHYTQISEMGTNVDKTNIVLPFNVCQNRIKMRNKMKQKWGQKNNFHSRLRKTPREVCCLIVGLLKHGTVETKSNIYKRNSQLHIHLPLWKREFFLLGSLFSHVTASTITNLRGCKTREAKL